MAVRHSLIAFAADSFQPLKAELERHVEDFAALRRIGGESALLETAHSTAADLAALAAETPLVFPRHVTSAVAEFDPVASSFASAADAVEAAVRENTKQPEVSLQVWLSGLVPYKFHRHDAWEDAARALADRGFTVSRADSDTAVSVCFNPKTAVAAVGRMSESLSSWPGGEIRLAKSPDQVSRAEFKLEELFKLHAIPLRPNGRALDFGAAPGGWTRILAKRGLTTTAVDPGDLDPRVRGLDRVVHERTTAGDFLRRTTDRFDLIVNDMKMAPARSSRLMLDSLPLLRPRGHAVLTLKTGEHRVLDQIDESFTLLRTAYDIEFARQLRHNRNEITAVLRPRA